MWPRKRGAENSRNWVLINLTDKLQPCAVDWKYRLHLTRDGINDSFPCVILLYIRGCRCWGREKSEIEIQIRRVSSFFFSHRLPSIDPISKLVFPKSGHKTRKKKKNSRRRRRGECFTFGVARLRHSGNELPTWSDVTAPWSTTSCRLTWRPTSSRIPVIMTIYTARATPKSVSCSPVCPTLPISTARRASTIRDSSVLGSSTRSSPILMQWVCHFFFRFWKLFIFSLSKGWMKHYFYSSIFQLLDYRICSYKKKKWVFIFNNVIMSV